MNDYQKKIITATERCSAYFSLLKLDKTYSLYYYTSFTKSDEEYKLLCDECTKHLRLVDANHGSTYKSIPGCFLPQNVRFLRIRLPDTSPILVAGDVLGENIDKVQEKLQKLGIPYHTQERPNNHIIEITSDDTQTAIYFPEKHFLQNK